MAWTLLTKEIVIARATYIEKTVTNTLGSNGEDPLQICIDNAVSTVRAAIEQGKKTRIDTAEGTVPASLVDTTLSIVVFNFASRMLNQQLQVQDARYQQYARAMEDIQKLREGKIIPEDPITGEVANTAAAVSTVSYRHNRFSREAYRFL